MNIVNVFEQQVEKYPAKKAVVMPYKDGYQSLTFSQLQERSRRFSANFSDMGISKGHKVLVFIKPSLDFSAVTFGLFRIGAIPVFIDPGMGRKNLLAAIEQVQPDGLIAEPIVHFMRLIFNKAFKKIKYHITTGNITWGSMRKLSQMQGDKALPQVDVKSNDMAAILFTSGGTGIPKGVEYTHKIFTTQTEILKSIYHLSPEDIDVPGFPLFSMFTMSMGMTSCIPDMNPSKPAKANPQKLFNNIMDHQATYVAGSPAIWERLADYCTDKGFVLPSVKYLVMFGAPVSLELIEKFEKLLPNGTVYTPYGATESLPVSNASGEFLLDYSRRKNLSGLGTCVGKPIEQIELKIIEIQEGPIGHYKELGQGQVGEIIVRGDMVTKRYYEMQDKTWESKIIENGTVWHRMGDVGYLDNEGYLWFCGRKTHQVKNPENKNGEPLFSVPCETIFNQHPEVKRTALVGPQKSGKIQPALVVERKDGKVLKGSKLKKFQEELFDLGQRHTHTQPIKNFYFKNRFPVDIRHNIKIDRLKLRDEVEQGRLPGRIQ